MKRRIKLSDLRVESFITTLGVAQKRTIPGGATNGNINCIGPDSPTCAGGENPNCGDIIKVLNTVPQTQSAGPDICESYEILCGSYPDLCENRPVYFLNSKSVIY